MLETENQINEIRPNLKRAKLAQLWIWIVMSFDIISISSSYLKYNLLKSMQNNEEVTDQMLSANDTREQIIVIVYIIVNIISAITFIQWFRRAYYNLSIRTYCDHSDGWAAASWFVPIISLFRPYQMMKEMWTETTQLINAKSSVFISNSTMIIGLWWTLWILSNVIAKYFLKSFSKVETIEQLLNSTLADITSSFIGIPLAIITVIIIKSYSLKEAKLSELEDLEIKKE